MKSNRFINGCGPDDLPPIVFSLAPAGLTLVTSIAGICPVQSSASNSRYAFAQPCFESSTTITVSDFSNFSGTAGSLLIYLYSTENPTPVPHISTYIVSSNDLGESTGKKAQLYPATLSLSSAAPEVITDLIDGITFRLNTNSFNSATSFSFGM